MLHTAAVARNTPWGEPDLQGTWDYWTFTPLERPAEFAGREQLTAAEAAQLRAVLTYDEKAVKRDLPDFVSMMLATGLRIGEVCAIT